MSLVSSVTSSAVAVVIPEDSGGPYVIAAYVVFLVLIAVYVAIMAQRLAKISKQAGELEQRVARLAGAGAGAVQGDARGGDSSAAPASPAAPTTSGSGDGLQAVSS